MLALFYACIMEDVKRKAGKLGGKSTLTKYGRDFYRQISLKRWELERQFKENGKKTK